MNKVRNMLVLLSRMEFFVSVLGLDLACVCAGGGGGGGKGGGGEAGVWTESDLLVSKDNPF